MKVYIVKYQNLDGHDYIDKVFLSEKAAELYCRSLDYHSYDEFEVDESEAPAYHPDNSYINPNLCLFNKEGQ